MAAKNTTTITLHGLDGIKSAKGATKELSARIQCVAVALRTEAHAEVTGVYTQGSAMNDAARSGFAIAWDKATPYQASFQITSTTFPEFVAAAAHREFPDMTITAECNGSTITIQPANDLTL